MPVCTLITYTSWKRAIIYERDPVTIAWEVATISYPTLTHEEIQKIEEATTDKIQEILSKY
jgi:hypothetical protein